MVLFFVILLSLITDWELPTSFPAYIFHLFCYTQALVTFLFRVDVTIFLILDGCLLPVCRQKASPELVRLAADPSVVWHTRRLCSRLGP